MRGRTATLFDVGGDRPTTLPTAPRRHQRWSRSVPQPDLPLDELRAYAPALSVPDDLERFWATTLAEARRHDLGATFEPIDNHLALVSTLDASYAGFGGSTVRGGLHLPADRSGPLPAVIGVSSA